ncbi:MAG: hypothetical protein Q7J08_08035 [Methanocorpusculum sp.]|uniref:hypothetical protein n=1 Tax=Methanocorpusculum sp. TaxID=2058474 RepID=UPI00271F0C0C|nr:hypothetical protein [Methanocorpusculum sp.]MDO9523641.1 hypothetical protein [Methanocorpusculum sp.]
MIPDNGTPTITELVERSCLSVDEVRASLARLEKAGLIYVKCENVCPLSLNDMFMMNEIRNTPSDIYIENGVIKVRK